MSSTTVGTIQYLVEIDTKSMKGQLKSIDQSVKSTAEGTEKAGEVGSKGFLKMGAAMGVVAGIASGITSKAINMVTNSIGAAVSRADTLSRFPTVMQNLGYSAADAQKEIKRMADSIIGLPTSLDQIATLSARLAPVSGSISKATDVALAFNNAVLAGGGPIYRQADAIEQFSQMLAKGVPDMMAWRTLQEAMPATLSQTAKALGITSGNTTELYDRLQDGRLSFKDFTDAIVELNSKGLPGFKSFADQAKDSTKGIQTGVQNAQTAITRGLTKIIDAVGAANVANAISGIGKGFEIILGTIANFIDFLKNNEGALLAFVTVAFGPLAGMAAIIAQNWDKIKPVIDNLVASFLVFWEAIRPLREFIATQLTIAFNDLKTAALNLWAQLQPFMPQLIMLGKVLLGVSLIITGTFVAALVAVITVASLVVTAIARVIGEGAKFLSWLTFLPARIISAVGNLGGVLYNAGRDLIQGLLNGAASLLRTVGSFFASKLPGALQGPFKKALGIASPSKVFAGFGKNITQGLVNGINAGLGDVQSAVGNMGVGITPVVNMPQQPSDLENIIANTNQTVTVVHKVDGLVVARSNSDMRDIFSQGIELVNQQRRAQGKAQI